MPSSALLLTEQSIERPRCAPKNANCLLLLAEHLKSPQVAKIALRSTAPHKIEKCIALTDNELLRNSHHRNQYNLSASALVADML